MFNDLLTSARGPGVIGTVLGLFVLAGFGSLFVMVTDDRFAGWKEDPNAVLKRQKDEITSLEAAIKNCVRDHETRVERRVIVDKLADLDATIGLFEPKLEAIRAEVPAIRQEMAAVREQKVKYLEEYRELERASAKGERYDELKLADGKTLSKVEVLDVDAARMQVRHAGGITGIDWQNLPDEMKDRFQFDVKEKEALLSVEGDDAELLRLQAKSVSTLKGLQMKRAQATDKRQEAGRAQSKANSERSMVQQLQGQVEAKRAQLALEQQKPVSRAPQVREELRALERRLSALPEQAQAYRDKAEKLLDEAQKIDEQAEDLEKELRDLQAQLKRRQEEVEAEEAEQAGEE